MAAPPTRFVKLRLTAPDGQVETPWAEPFGGFFRLDNLPWLAYGVSDDDLIEATPTEDVGVYEFVRVVKPSGNRLVRAIVNESPSIESLLDHLAELGCHCEGFNRKLIAVSIPPEVDADTVCSYLTEVGARWEHANPASEPLDPGGD